MQHSPQKKNKNAVLAGVWLREGRVSSVFSCEAGTIEQSCRLSVVVVNGTLRVTG